MWFHIGDCVRGVTPFERLPPRQIISSLVVRSVQELQQNSGIWDVLLERSKATEFHRNVLNCNIKLIIPGVLTPSDSFCNISCFYDTCPWVLTDIVKGSPCRYMNARELMILQQATRKLPRGCCLQVVQEGLSVYPYHNSHSISHLPASLFIRFVPCFGKTLLLHISVAKIFANKWTPIPQEMMFEYPHFSGMDPWWQTGMSHALNVVGILLICDKSVTTQNWWLKRRNFKGFEVPYFSMSATTTQLLSSG